MPISLKPVFLSFSQSLKKFLDYGASLSCPVRFDLCPYLSLDEQCEFLYRMDFDAIFQLTISMSNICQSFQTLYEASPIINVTHRSFAVFHPIMYVTHRSFAAPAPAIRDFFWLYTIHILYYAGVSIMPPRVRGQNPAGAITRGFL